MGECGREEAERTKASEVVVYRSDGFCLYRLYLPRLIYLNIKPLFMLWSRHNGVLGSVRACWVGRMTHLVHVVVLPDPCDSQSHKAHTHTERERDRQTEREADHSDKHTRAHTKNHTRAHARIHA